MKRCTSSFVALGALLCFVACSGDDTPSTATGGLALTVAADGSITPDRVHVKVASDTTVFFDGDLALATTPLPWTSNIDTKGGDSATVEVQAWSGSTPLDRRDVSVTALPKDSFAPVQVLLSGACTPHAHAANDGSITSDCAAGTTCDPATGACGNDLPPTGGCTTGARRCNGLNVETCSADGTWLYNQACAYTCEAGACTGTCVPGHKVCCATVVVDGQAQVDCDANRFNSTCISGTGTCTGGAGVSTLVVQGCDQHGHPIVVDDCSRNQGALPDGDGTTTTVLGCGVCPDTSSETCFKFDGSHACVPN